MFRASMWEMKRSDMCVLLVQQPHHLLLADAQDRARRDRRRGAHPQRLAGQAALAEEVAGPSIATTASLPALDSTDSLTPPDWM